MLTVSSGLEAFPVSAHEVSFYDHDVDAVAVITRFALAGLSNGESVVVLTTDDHRAALDAELRVAGVDPVLARAAGRLVTLDSAEALGLFMEGGSPAPDRFALGIGDLLREARSTSPAGVRVYGDMVAVLWNRGDVMAALELERLWNELALHERFALLCAYPVSVLGPARLEDVSRVCALHSGLRPPQGYGSSSISPARDDGRGFSEVFLPVPGAVAAARRFVTAVLELWGDDGLSWDAALVTSEIATNAITHTQAPFRTTVTRSERGVRIGVEDVGTGVPARGPGSDTGLGGRGMAIVEELCQRWGWEPLATGKVVWAELSGARVPAVDVRN
ncbi:MAG: MEDS domain-containing protein [Nocardioidaceae bacterium]